MKTYAKLIPLVQNPGSIKTSKDLDLDEASKNLVKGLAHGREQGSFEMHVLDDDSVVPFRIELNMGKPVLSRQSGALSNFMLRASRATAAEMAKGELSPVDAYLAGRLEVHGDLEFGKRLYARLAAKGGLKEF